MIEELDVRTADGRTIGTAALGPPGGLPVLWHDGNPGSRVPPVSESVLEAAGVRRITYDRPGGGRSTPRPGRVVADVKDDAAAILDAWGAERLATMGISGGGAFALATAALLPDRVVAAAGLSGAAPIDAEGLNFTAGMAECLRRSAEGWLDDSIAFASPWGFDVQRVSCPVSIWHGRDDTASPIGHARWLAARIPGAELHELEGGHYAPCLRFPEILAWLAARGAGTYGS